MFEAAGGNSPFLGQEDFRDGWEAGNFSTSCCFKNCVDEFQWTFFGVYGPVVDSNRELFWEELGLLSGLWNNPRWWEGVVILLWFVSPVSEGREKGCLLLWEGSLKSLKIWDTRYSCDWLGCKWGIESVIEG